LRRRKGGKVGEWEGGWGTVTDDARGAVNCSSRFGGASVGAIVAGMSPFVLLVLQYVTH